MPVVLNHLLIELRGIVVNMVHYGRLLICAIRWELLWLLLLLRCCVILNEHSAAFLLLHSARGLLDRHVAGVGRQQCVGLPTFFDFFVLYTHKAQGK